MTTQISLREYQEEALSAVFAARDRGMRRMLLCLPPGAGKTVIFVTLIHRLGGRALILCHRDELIGQAREKVHMLAPGLTVGTVQGPCNELDADVIVASVPTLAQPRRLDQLPADLELVIADECHHGAALTWQAVFDHLRAGRPGGPLLLGVTATPDRADGKGIDHLYGDIVYEALLVDLIRRDYLSDLRARRVLYSADFRQLEVRHGDVTAGSAERAFLGGAGPAAVWKAIEQEAADRKHIIVFTPGVESAAAVATLLNYAKIPAAALSGKTPMDERRAVLEQFRTGEIRVLVNCQILTEGVDLPMVDAIVLARPTKSRALYVQMAGRGFRKHPLKADCLLLDLTANSSRHQLVTPASLVGLEPSEVRPGESLSEAVARKQQEPIALSLTGNVTVHSRPIDILRQRPAAWVAVPGGRYALPLGESQIVLHPNQKNASLWSVVEHHRDGAREVLQQGFSIGYAMGVGEARAKEKGAGGLVNPHARWRQKPASDSQLAYLRHLGVTIPREPISMGEASQLISAAKAARAS